MLELLEEENSEITCKGCGRDVSADKNKCPYCGLDTQLPTILDQGKRLPIGILDNDQILKEFDVRKINFEIEQEISEAWQTLVKRKNDISPIEKLLVILSYTVTDIAGKDFQNARFDKRMMFLKRMFAGDPFYMYALVRLETLGETFSLLDIPCSCGKILEQIDIDLKTLEVATIDTIDKLQKEVNLLDGFKLNGKIRRVLKIQVPYFSTLCINTDKGSTSLFGEQLKDSVIAIDNEDLLLTDDELKQLTKRDMNILEESFDVFSGGPQWTVSITCPRCNETFDLALPVVYENFFRTSYRYGKKRI